MRTQLERWEYEILEDNTVEAWYLDALNNDVPGCPPNMRQHQHPDGSPFDTREKAASWIEGHIRAFTAAVEAAKAEAAKAEEAQPE